MRPCHGKCGKRHWHDFPVPFEPGRFMRYYSWRSWPLLRYLNVFRPPTSWFRLPFVRWTTVQSLWLIAKGWANLAGVPLWVVYLKVSALHHMRKAISRLALCPFGAVSHFVEDDFLRYTVKRYQRRVTLCGRKEEQVILMQDERVKASIEASRTGDSWISWWWRYKLSIPLYKQKAQSHWFTSSRCCPSSMCAPWQISYSALVSPLVAFFSKSWIMHNFGHLVR